MASGDAVPGHVRHEPRQPIHSEARDWGGIGINVSHPPEGPFTEGAGTGTTRPPQRNVL